MLVTTDTLTPEVIHAFHVRVKPGVGDHRIWVGTTDGRVTPILWIGKARYAALRVAWVLYHGAPPEGIVKNDCGVPLCTWGPHLTDAARRQHAAHLHAAVYGRALTGTCNRNHDRAMHSYVDNEGKVKCRACANERRRKPPTAQEGHVTA